MLLHPQQLCRHPHQIHLPVARSVRQTNYPMPSCRTFDRISSRIFSGTHRPACHNHRVRPRQVNLPGTWTILQDPSLMHPPAFSTLSVSLASSLSLLHFLSFLSVFHFLSFLSAHHFLS